jgi:hypothetical protein
MTRQTAGRNGKTYRGKRITILNNLFIAEEAR